jgi:DNA-binding transcriptional MerR regulator
MNKKYYTINEVSNLVNVSQASLRYFEKISPKFKICKIRGRRYYTEQDIQNLNAHFCKGIKMDGENILMQIEYLEKQFNNVLSVIRPVVISC